MEGCVSRRLILFVTLMVLADAYREEQVEGETRVVLGLAPAIAPIKVAVLPLMKKEGMPPGDYKFEVTLSAVKGKPPITQTREFKILERKQQ